MHEILEGASCECWPSFKKLPCSGLFVYFVLVFFKVKPTKENVIFSSSTWCNWNVAVLMAGMCTALDYNYTHVISDCFSPKQWLTFRKPPMIFFSQLEKDSFLLPSGQGFPFIVVLLSHHEVTEQVLLPLAELQCANPSRLDDPYSFLFFTGRVQSTEIEVRAVTPTEQKQSAVPISTTLNDMVRKQGPLVIFSSAPTLDR